MPKDVHGITSYSSDFITSIRNNVNGISKRFVNKYSQVEFGNPEVYNTEREKTLLTVKSSVHSKCLNFVSLNIRSLKNKTTSLFDFIVSQNIDVLALTETWLCCGDNAVLNDLLPPGYDIRHVDRERRGGGVALIYKRHFISKYSTHT